MASSAVRYTQIGLLMAWSIGSGLLMAGEAAEDDETRHVILNFYQQPRSAREQALWNRQMHEAVDEVNALLIKRGHLGADLEEIDRRLATEKLSWWRRLCLWCQRWYIKCCFRTYSLSYPHRKNRAFFTRTDYDQGIFTVYIPDGVSRQTFEKLMTNALDSVRLPVRLERDQRARVLPIEHGVYAPFSKMSGLEGASLTLQELEQLKRGLLAADDEQEILSLKAALNTKGQNDTKKLRLDQLTARQPYLTSMRQCMFWHQEFPTVGLRPTAQTMPPAYPYLPHCFTLWQLAPNQGKGITVAVIDTGMAAFTVEDPASVLPAYRKNQDLLMAGDVRTQNFNLVSYHGLDPLEQLVSHVLHYYMRSDAFDHKVVEQAAPGWIYDYVRDGKTEKIEQFLLIYGHPSLATQGTLTDKGREALRDITTGQYGIIPRGVADAHRPFTLARVAAPFNADVILQFLPASRIETGMVTFTAGHGSHTSGTIGGRLQGAAGALAPTHDTGICGLAPQADIIMLKAFQENGQVQKSVITAALQRALKMDADVVNMSLKVADEMIWGMHEYESLQRVVDQLPYVICASGNNGDPAWPGYAGKRESYPARMGNVAFDVGAFQYDSSTSQAPIAAFSQFEPGVGPKCAAPGFNMLGAALVPSQRVDSQYLFMAGTSMATPMMSGFVALMLGEFKHDFTRSQLLDVCYTCMVKLHAGQGWDTKVMLGTLDMRTALFMLHALKRLRGLFTERSSRFATAAAWPQLVQALHHLLIAPAQEYANAHLQRADFTQDFMTFFTRAQDLRRTPDWYVPASLDEALNRVCTVILDVAQQHEQPLPATAWIAPQVYAQVYALLHQPHAQLFAHLPEALQWRIAEAKHDGKAQGYWKERGEDMLRQIETIVA